MTRFAAKLRKRRSEVPRREEMFAITTGRHAANPVKLAGQLGRQTDRWHRRAEERDV
jgi:hypothetical protein